MAIHPSPTWTVSYAPMFDGDPMWGCGDCGEVMWPHREEDRPCALCRIPSAFIFKLDDAALAVWYIGGQHALRLILRAQHPTYKFRNWEEAEIDSLRWSRGPAKRYEDG